MKIVVNGQEVEVAEGATVGEALRAFGVSDARGTAVAVQGEVVPRSSWGEFRLAEGQRVEVVRAVQGG